MKRRQVGWIALPLVLTAGLVLMGSLAGAKEQCFPTPSQLTADQRSRVAEAARNSAIAPWQRELMLEVARGSLTGAESHPSPVLPGLARTRTGALADDCAWKVVPPPFERLEHTAVYDPVRDRMVVFGGDGFNITFNDAWALPLAGSPDWSTLDPVGSPPAARHSHTAIYDPLRDRIVVFGGRNHSGDQYYNDVWALSLSGSPAWTPLVPAGSPPAARFGHTAIYDPVRDRMVVFGGFDSTGLRNDTWALSLAGTPAWSAIAPAGSPPAARHSHTAIYDPVRDRMVVFGGGGGSGLTNDVWALSLAGSPAWSAIAPVSSPLMPSYEHTAIYDPVRDRMIVYGGYGNTDVWALSLAESPAWTELAPAGSPPLPRYGHTAIYDPVRDRMVVFGGDDGDFYIGSNDVWALSLEGGSAWSALSAAAGPSPRVDPTAIYDPLRYSMVVFGGYGTPPSSNGSLDNNEVWSLSLAGSQADWTALSTAGLPPTARSEHTAIYDPVRDRMVVFGGYSDGVDPPPPGYLNDVWALSLAGSPAWIELDPVGSPPPARLGHTAIYDPVRDRMIVFGGSSDGHLNNDVWALSLAETPAWIALDPAGSPPAARFGHMAIYDPERDRMVVFCGYDSTSLRNDTWALSLAGTPAWTALAPAGDTPSARGFPAAVYDPVRDRVVVCGGSGYGYDVMNDVWALSLAGTPTWSALAPAGSQPPGTFGHAAIYVQDRMVVFGGISSGMYSNDVWALEWKAPSVSVPGTADAHRRRCELTPPRPNPSRGTTTVDFELAEPGRVVLDVLDIHGRRVRRIADGWFTAGRHASMWRGDDDRGHALGSGVYFVRMQGTGFQATRRIVRIP